MIHKKGKWEQWANFEGMDLKMGRQNECMGEEETPKDGQEKR